MGIRRLGPVEVPRPAGESRRPVCRRCGTPIDPELGRCARCASSASTSANRSGGAVRARDVGELERTRPPGDAGPSSRGRPPGDVGLPAGTFLGGGRYEITAITDTGPASVWYRARDHRLRRSVLVEEFLPADVTRRGRRVLVAPRSVGRFETDRERFVTRARALGRLTGPGIARVFEVFDENGTSYVVAENVEGPSLRELLDERGEPFPETTVRDVAHRVARSLRPAHAIDVVHGALRPEVLVLTATGRLVVTRFELGAGDDSIDRGIDVLGLATTLLHLATGSASSPQPAPASTRSAVPPRPSPPPSLPSPSERSAHPPAGSRDASPPPPEPSAGLVDELRRMLDGAAPDGPGDLDSLLGRLGIGPPAASVFPVPYDTVTDLAAPADGGPAPAGSGWSDPTGSTDSRAPTAGQPGPTGGPAPVSTPVTGGGADATAMWSSMTDRTEFADPDATLHEASAGPRGAQDGTILADDRSPVASAPDPLVTPVGDPGSGYSVADRRLLLPLGLATVVLTGVAPIVGAALLALVLLPLLATIGDRRARLVEHTADPTRPSRRDVPWLPLWFVGNVLRSLIRAVPALIVGGGLFLVHDAAFGADGATASYRWGLRGIGALMTLMLCAGVTRPGRRFRTRAGLDALWARIEPRGRVGERLIAVWIVLLAMIVAALLLDPSPFPLS